MQPTYEEINVVKSRPGILSRKTCDWRFQYEETCKSHERRSETTQ